MRKPFTRWLSAPWRHVSVLLWPVGAFKRGVLAVLHCDRAYFAAFSESLHEAAPLEAARLRLMQEMALPRGLYPEWVFARGFNTELRASYRYFLLTLDRVHELILASHQVFKHHMEAELINDLLPELKPIINHHLALVDVLIYFFETGEWVDLTPHEDNILNLERRVPAWQMNVLSWSRSQADIRDALLQLIMTLPAKQPKEVLC